MEEEEEEEEENTVQEAWCWPVSLGINSTDSQRPAVFALQATLGNIWRDFWLSQLRRSFWHLVERGQGCHWTSCSAQAGPHGREVPTPECQLCGGSETLIYKVV